MNKMNVLGWESVQFFNIVSIFSTSLVDLRLGSGKAGESYLSGADLLGEIIVADSDKFLGDAGFSLDNFNYVTQLRLPFASQLVLKKMRYLGWNSLLPNTSRFFYSELRLFLFLGASALAILKHEAKSDQLGLGHHASLGRLKISSTFSIQVSAKTGNSASQNMLVALDFHSFTISNDMDSILLGDNGLNSILVVGHVSIFIIINVLTLGSILLLLLMLLLLQLLYL